MTDLVPPCDAVVAGTVRSRHRSTTGRRGSHRVRGRRVLRGPLGDRRGRGRLALVIITGALTSCGVALPATSRGEKARSQRPTPSSHSRPHGGALRCDRRRAEPRWRASGRWCSCLEWLQAVSGGAHSAATVTNRPGLKGGFVLWPSGRQLEAQSTWASGRRGGGDQGPWAMIASTDPAITPKRATCGSSRLATRGLVAIGNAGETNTHNTGRD
jgi:hypothetical protein